MSIYLIDLSPTCIKCAETIASFNYDRIRVVIVFALVILNCIVRGIRQKRFPDTHGVLTISLFWAGTVLTISLVYQSLTKELLFKLVNVDGVLTMGIGAVMTIYAGFSDEAILADTVMTFRALKSISNRLINRND